MEKIFYVMLIGSMLGPSAIYAVMPPSTSLEKPVEKLEVDGWISGRYQVIPGRVTVLVPAKEKSVQNIETMVKLDRESGKTWVLEVIADGPHHYAKRWVELSGF